MEGCSDARLYPVRFANAAGIAKGKDLSAIPPDCDGPPALPLIARGSVLGLSLSRRTLCFRFLHRTRTISKATINTMPAIPPTTPPTTAGVEGAVLEFPVPPAEPAPAVLVDELLRVDPAPPPKPAPPATVGVGVFKESYDTVDDWSDGKDVESSEDSENDVVLSVEVEMSEVEVV